jgi:hypothetical protein
MPQRITNPNLTIGEVVFSWTVKEYEQHVRERRWYIVMGSIAILLIAYAIISTNYLFALIVVLFGIVMYLHDMQAPMELPFTITTTGLVLGSKYYRFSEVTNFWIIYSEGGVKNLYFSLASPLRHRLRIPLGPADPIVVREYLLDYLPEDLEQEEEPLSDRLSRLLKLH